MSFNLSTMYKVGLGFLFYFAILYIAQAQTPPQLFNYSAVTRDINAQPIANAEIGIQISILQGSASGTSVYTETHTVNTDEFGLFNLVVGGGDVQAGSFASIHWSEDDYYLEVSMDVNGGMNFLTMGTTQLLSVPYAMHSATSDSLINGITISAISTTGDTLYLSNGQIFTSGGGEKVDLVLPSITTYEVTGITSNSGTFGGIVTNANGNYIMERGIVYGTSPNPTLNATKIALGSGSGGFDTIFNVSYQYPHLLTANTTYYIRAYALTENNVSAYGNEVSFTTLPVGQTGPGGGLVFYDKGNDTGGWQYLEAAPYDQSQGIAWGCHGTAILNTQRWVGSGRANTDLIVAGCNDPGFAAKLCDDLDYGGQIDWFLPSLDELYLMYHNLHINFLGNFYTSTSYWSSSELFDTDALILDFGFGGLYDIDRKNKLYYVRAIRAY
jgi:hypothetical protein